MAQKLNLKNTDATLTNDEAFHTFPLIQYYLDEPDSNPSVVPLYFLTKLAKDHGYKAMLSGEGADELFAGYTAYGYNTNSKAIKWLTNRLAKLPKAKRERVANWLKHHKNFHGRLHMYNNLAAARDSFIGQARVFTPEEAEAILQPAYQQAPSVQEIVDRTYDRIDDQAVPELSKKQYLDIHQWMPGDILLKADKMSMANSLELRVPLLDKEMMKVAGHTPAKYLLTDQGTKWAFRMAANRHLPEEWATREKLGFPVPVREWLRQKDFYEEVLEIFKQDFVGEFFDQAKLLAMAQANFEGKTDDRRKLWTIYTFLVWYKLYFIDNFNPHEEVELVKEGAKA